MSTVDGIELRTATSADRPEILELLAASLGWDLDDDFAEFFAWKHERNLFGPSPAWVASHEGKVIAFRTFVRWEFDHPDGRVRHAVRAVDTATHREFRGRGLFRRLTLHALDELRSEGIDFVFNTPNDQSRPGYLAMGWVRVGRVPIGVRVTSPLSVWRMARSRVAAERWPDFEGNARRVSDVLDEPGVDELLADLAPLAGLRTPRTRAYFAWRYGLPQLGYQVVSAPAGARHGIAIFRVRRRGHARETTVCEVLAPKGNARAARALMRQVHDVANSDYALRVGADPTAGYLPLVGRGPVLTWRGVAEPVATPPPLDTWQLSLGDVELF